MRRTKIYKLISDLHFIGIGHGDLEPRNIVRDSEGSFKIIDFSMCWFHDCPGIKTVNGIHVSQLTIAHGMENRVHGLAGVAGLVGSAENSNTCI